MISLNAQRGFTLLIAVVLTSVALGISLALLDIAYKQVVLATSAKQSQTAFYAADSVMECALYYDQQVNSFSYSNPTGGILCGGMAVTGYSTSVSGNTRTTTYTVPCATGGATVLGTATIYKTTVPTTQIFVTGYNTCTATNPRRIERGLKTFY